MSRIQSRINIKLIVNNTVPVQLIRLKKKTIIKPLRLRNVFEMSMVT